MQKMGMNTFSCTAMSPLLGDGVAQPIHPVWAMSFGPGLDAEMRPKLELRLPGNDVKAFRTKSSR